MTPLSGYPTSWGNKRASVFPLSGPALYTRVNLGSPAGSPVSGGQTVEAVSAGFKLFDFLVGGITDDGLYEVLCIPVGDSSEPGAAPKTTYKAQWFVVATRAEVADAVDLSGSTIRFLGIGDR